MSQAGRETRAVSVIDKNGVRAEVEFAHEENYGDGARVLVRTSEGANYLVPAAILVGLKDGGYFLPLSLRDLTPDNASLDNMENGDSDKVISGSVSGTANAVTLSDANGEMLVVPVIAEELIIGKRVVERGRVRITRRRSANVKRSLTNRCKLKRRRSSVSRSIESLMRRLRCATRAM